jgi:hypothetical protein
MVGRVRPNVADGVQKQPLDMAGWAARRVSVPAALVAVACLAVYLATMGRTVGAADTFEFQVVAPALGIAHPTGYPLFLLLGKLFSLIPVGQVAWRVNLVSVVSATSAVTLLYTALGHLGARRTPALVAAAAASAALMLAFSPVFWSQAIEAEVYALNAAFVTGILALFVAALTAKTAGRRVGPRWLYALAALCSLALTHHLTSVLLAPAVVLGLWCVRPAMQPRQWIAALALGAAMLSVELYLPLRWPALHNGALLAPADWLAWITGQRFGGAVRLDLWRDGTRWRILGGLLWDAFGPVGAGLAALGLAWLAVRRRPLALMTFVAFAAYCAYGLIYNVADVSVFVLPAHIFMAFWAGAALMAAAGWLDRQTGRAKQALRALLWAGCVLLPMGLIVANVATVNRSTSGWERYRWGRYVLGLPLPPGSVILADSEKIAPLYYLTTVEKVRPDVQAMVLGSETEYQTELQRRVAAGQPVFLARYLPDLAGRYRLSSQGPLVRVDALDTPVGPPPTIQHSLAGATWEGGQIALLGYDAARGEDGTAWRVTLYWTARSRVTTAYHVRLRWVSPDGHVWWADPGANPAGGMGSMVAWQPGVVSADYHEVPADPTIPPGDWRLEVGLFLPFRDGGPARDGAAAGAAAGQGAWQPIATLAQTAAPSARSAAFAPLRRTYGGELWIAASSAAGGLADLGVLPPGETVEVPLTWGRTQPGPDRTLRLHWTQGETAAGQPFEVQPYAGAYPTSAWPVGSALAGKAALPAPASAGVYTLRAGWVDASGRPLPAHCGWLAPVTDDCAVASLEVAGTARDKGTNFDNQALLTVATLGQTTRRAGEVLDITLQWQGLRRWDADYTAFVHLIGPDGKLHGQMDQWPMDGTLPTTGWSPGRVVDDPYHVRLAYDAPPGKYEVEVGWYLLATSRRLPVLDASGRPMDDRAIIGTFMVLP